MKHNREGSIESIFNARISILVHLGQKADAWT